MRLRRVLGRCLSAAVVLSGMAGASVCAKSTLRPSATPGLRLKVVRVYPHDPRAFTQGLLHFDGHLYESTGLVGHSSLRRVDLASGMTELEAKLPDELFGEGLARVGQRLLQLTWKNGKVLIWDLATFRKEGELSYEGEGWGLCFDGRRLIMSDGSARLTLRDPASFAKQGEMEVRLGSRPLSNLNELECADGVIYANVWQDNHIAQIDPATGKVTAWIDASDLLTPSEAARADVLNGIAALPTTGRLLVTGKLWPHIYEVELVEDQRTESKQSGEAR